MDLREWSWMQEAEFYRDLIFIARAKIWQMHQYDDELYWSVMTLLLKKKGAKSTSNDFSFSFYDLENT